EGPSGARALPMLPLSNRTSLRRRVLTGDTPFRVRICLAGATRHAPSPGESEGIRIHEENPVTHPAAVEDRSAPILSVRDLHKTYGRGPSRFDALRGVTLDIREGESVAIVGKSGSGKSTLMHVLALLDQPSQGA